MNPRRFWPLAAGLVGLAVLAVAVVQRPSPPAPAPRLPTPTPTPTAVEPPRPEAAPPVPRTTPPADPILRQWQNAIRLHNAKGVLDSQTYFLAREGEYREPLSAMAKDDPDPRIRAFCVAVLGRMKSPPAESFFLERLGDASEHPRTSALQALEKVGTSGGLDAIERLAASDPVDAVRTAAARTSKAVRSR